MPEMMYNNPDIETCSWTAWTIEAKFRDDITPYWLGVEGRNFTFTNLALKAIHFNDQTSARNMLIALQYNSDLLHAYPELEDWYVTDHLFIKDLKV